MLFNNLTEEDVKRLRGMGAPMGAFGSDLNLTERVCDALLAVMKRLRSERGGQGLLIEEPFGFCPVCALPVFPSAETPYPPLWVQRTQLSKEHGFRNLPGDYEDELPIHHACYNQPGATW